MWVWVWVVGGGGGSEANVPPPHPPFLRPLLHTVPPWFLFPFCFPRLLLHVADPTLHAALFSSAVLKHSVCSALDFVLNDKAACAKAFAQAAELGAPTPLHADTFFLPEDLAQLQAAAKVCCGHRDPAAAPLAQRCGQNIPQWV